MAFAEEECSSTKSRSASNNDSHYLAKCVLKGSVVLHVVHGRIRSPSFSDIVFGKETSLELVIIGEDGIVQSVCEQAVFGTIKDLAVLRWNERFHHQNLQMQGRDLLVVVSDSGKLSFLRFCNEMHRFFPVTHVQLSSPGNLRNQLGQMLAIDSNGCFIATSAYEDRLAMFSISMATDSDIIDKRIFYPPEIEGDSGVARSVHRTSISGTIWSMCFISKDLNQPSGGYNPVLAIILNRRGAVLTELVLLEWIIIENAVRVISQYAEAGHLAHSIVEVPHSYGFAFLFRIGDALLMDLRDAHNPCCVYKTSLNILPTSVEQNFAEESCRVHDGDEDGIFNVAASALLELKDYVAKGDDPMNVDGDSGMVKSTSKHVCALSWEPGNETNSRMIFCVDTGELFMIEISFDSDGPKVNLSDCLYRGLSCKALLWFAGGFLAALVEMGDGMVLKLEQGRLVYRSPIQNIAPILDMSVVDCHDEEHDQMFACCGVTPEGSLRIIRSGISVEKLLRTAPIYQGITGTWTVKMKVIDSYHSFLVLSFVEETRVLSVGLSFTDVTDSVGFQPDVSTLACGVVDDGLLVQIHKNGVKLCLPTTVAHPEGIPLASPICTSWFPENISISLGAVGYNLIVVATSSPCFLFILGVRSVSAYQYEIYEMQHVRLQNEVSCISIPHKHFDKKPSTFLSNLVDNSSAAALLIGVNIGRIFVIGTHKPSVEILSFLPDEGLRILASGAISLTNTLGTAVSGCVPQDARLVLVDRFYVLSGLRNGMLLRFELPAASMVFSSELSSHSPSVSSCSVNDADTNLSNMMAPNSIGPQMCAINLSEETNINSPVNLQLIAIRRIGITPVFLVPLSDSLEADIIALSDRPWLLQSARHSLSYTSISFQPSTHVTPVCSMECPMGILFVAENSLHLVEMVHSKRLNVQKFYLGGTPRKVLYHSESRLLLVMRTELSQDTYSSDICCVDPLSGSVLSSFKLELGETGKSMELVRVVNEQVLVIGTSLSSGPAMMPSGEAESTKGRLIVLCLEHMQNSDSGSMTFCSKAGSSSQRTSPFREIVGYAAEQLSGSSLCSSPDDTSCDGVRLEESEAWQLRLAYTATWPGMVLAICPYLDRYFLASAGNSIFVFFCQFYVCGFPNDNPQRVRRFAVGRTRFMIMSLTAHFTRIAVGDCRDGVVFYSYHEDSRKLEQLYCDPEQRLVADCILMDVDTAVVSDRKGSIAVLSCSNHLEDNASPECNLTLNCSYYMGEIAMSIKKGSFSYKLPADDVLKGCDGSNTIIDFSENSIMAGTLLGSIIMLIPISREEHELLEAVQARLAVHQLTAPILGNDHNEFRSRENSVRKAGVSKILDGDMLAQFLELTSMQQEAVLALPLGSLETVTSSSKQTLLSPISVNRVVQLLERVHYALN
ncbi:pre-mRNA-splicing factor prp12 isoform X1 [Vitis riparia]|uniref:pre-mRNA-splicing factor prp12 isoform X1 n=1 Tax=Vitis riparia TaxID=96939 RepID=UPI00155AA436|nr:pre-mRNA-splicing factor prp12 isoform X1 [Vitis riparia]